MDEVGLTYMCVGEISRYRLCRKPGYSSNVQCGPQTEKTRSSSYRETPTSRTNARPDTKATVAVHAPRP